MGKQLTLNYNRLSGNQLLSTVVTHYAAVNINSNKYYNLRLAE
jgi:hypothetical protein